MQRSFPILKSHSRVAARRALYLLPAVGALLASYAVHAQNAADQTSDQASSDQSTTLQEVVVTGTHIARANPDTVVNIQTISSQDLMASGQSTVADYLRTVSSSFGNNVNESFSDSFAAGASMLGLRGLTGSDTLILLDGHRITQYGLFQNGSDGFVDLNVIPLEAIDHVEILKSGGSAIYGSDAVSGVVNIILKQNSTEKSFSAGDRLTTDGGGNARDANLSFGFGDFASQGFNVFTTASIYKRDQLLMSQRENTSGQDYSGLPDGFNVWNLANQYAPTGGSTSAFATCGKNGLPGSAFSGEAGPGCYYNAASQQPLSPETERANVTSTFNVRLGSVWTGYGDLFFSNENTFYYYTPTPFNSGALVYNPATGGAITVSNVLPASNPSALGGVATPIDYSFQSLGGRNEVVVSNTFRILVGAKASIGGWDLDGSYGYSQNHVDLTTEGEVNANVLGTDIANGAYDFADPAASAAGVNSALGLSDTQTSTATLNTFDFSGNTSLFQLSGGPLKTSLGAELRRESVDDEPSPLVTEGLVLNEGFERVVGSRTVLAAFGEADLPLLRSLDLDLALREEHYSDIGSNLEPQITLHWQPIREVGFRAAFSHGFRAPSFAENGQASQVGFTDVSDPNDPLGRPTESIGQVTAGNPHLKPEISKNLDLGLVVTPAHNASLSVDFYDLMLSRVIAVNGTAQDIVDDPSAFPNELTRTPGGEIAYETIYWTNKYKVYTSGIDIDPQYTLPLTSDSQLKLAIDSTYVLRFDIFDGDDWTNYTGTNDWFLLSPIYGGGAVPRWKGDLSATWSNPAWMLGADWRYINGYQNVTTLLGITTQPYVASWDAVDLNGEYRGLKNWKLDLSVVNVMNRYPPYDSSQLIASYITNAPYDSTLYDDFGRMVDFHFTYTF
ncbi:MAG TPA: TonB-dependent receptor [Steroidobacteraceae bacterium]|jgi:iron complex outermembrane receptor protein|nr:TonB-dependent receptor [Steroidobacteraceae bacterium]